MNWDGEYSLIFIVKLTRWSRRYITSIYLSTLPSVALPPHRPRARRLLIRAVAALCCACCSRWKEGPVRGCGRSSSPRSRRSPPPSSTSVTCPTDSTRNRCKVGFLLDKGALMGYGNYVGDASIGA